MGFLIFIYICLTIFTVADLCKHRVEGSLGFNKFVWFLIIVGFPILGAAWWFIENNEYARQENFEQNFNKKSNNKFEDNPDFIRYLRDINKKAE